MFPPQVWASGLEWTMESMTGLSVNDLPDRTEDDNMSKAQGWRRSRGTLVWKYPAELDEQPEAYSQLEQQTPAHPTNPFSTNMQHQSRGPGGDQPKVKAVGRFWPPPFVLLNTANNPAPRCRGSTRCPQNPRMTGMWLESHSSGDNRVAGTAPPDAGQITGEYVSGRLYTDSMEGFWGMLKRNHHGTCRWMSPKYLRFYVIEFFCRHTIRLAGAVDQGRTFIRGLESQRLPCREFTA